MYLQSFRLDGQVAVVTGGSKGIGRSIALGFAEAGAKQVIVARSQSELDKVVEEIKSIGGEAISVAADLCDQNGIDKVYEKTVETYGKCDILVNNAGINIRNTNSFEMGKGDLEKVIDLNLIAAFNMTLKFGKSMCQQKSGCIVNMSSIAGTMAVRTGSAYAMSKAGLIEMTKYLALEWGKYGVRINAIAPWYFVTPLTDTVLKNESYKNKVLGRTMLPRLGEMVDLASLTVFLASEASSFITAQTIYCDGGMKEYGFDPTV